METKQRMSSVAAVCSVASYYEYRQIANSKKVGGKVLNFYYYATLFSLFRCVAKKKRSAILFCSIKPNCYQRGNSQLIRQKRCQQIGQSKIYPKSTRFHSKVKKLVLSTSRNRQQSFQMVLHLRICSVYRGNFFFLNCKINTYVFGLDYY